MKQRFEVLDSFRGLCAISVVIYHMHIVGSITEWDFFRGSSEFVDFFFVLSGFVLAYRYGFKENISFKRFIKARFFRLFPLHLFMLMIFVFIECGKFLAYKYGGYSFKYVPFTGIGDIAEIIPNLLLIHSWTRFTEHLAFNSPSWSISIEFYVYIIFYFTIAIFGRKKSTVWVVVSLIMFALIATKSEVFVSPVLRGLSCFFGGAFTYVIYLKINTIYISKWVASLIEGLLLLLVIIVVQNQFEYRPIVASLIFFAVVLFFAFEIGYISIFFKKGLFLTAGKLSYSIYMTHYGLLSCLKASMMIIQKLTGNQVAPLIDGVRTLTSGNIIINNLIVFLFVGLVVFISSLTYRYIEIKGKEIGNSIK